LASINNTGGARTFGYDGRGNLASESRPGSISAATSYDGYARTDIGTLSFAYNGRDDRVAQTSSTGAREFVYDAAGRVLGEYGASVAT
jgi:YD repeat-containing protein